METRTSATLPAGGPAQDGGDPARTRARDGGDDEYLELSRQVRQAGLMERRPVHYVLRIGVNMILFAGGWVAFFLVGNSWFQLAIAAYLAVIFAQTGFIGHDIGHRQVVASRRLSDLAGLLHANLAIGVSYGYWVDKHNRHHAYPNRVDKDPDVGPSVIAWSAAQASDKRGAAKALARCQAVVFFPLLLLEAFNLHAFSVRCIPKRAVRHKQLEAVLLVAHLAGYLAALVIVLSPVRAILFVLVQQALLGLYLGCAFAPNHKGMPMPVPGDDANFLRRQVLTSRNVRGGRLVSLALGGLNYQIEHHLFPTMPMASLRRSQPLVRAFCDRQGLSYCETGIIGSYVQALRHLHDAGRPLRKAGPLPLPLPLRPSP